MWGRLIRCICVSTREQALLLLLLRSWERSNARNERGGAIPLETSAAPTRVALAFSIDQARRLVPFAVWSQRNRAPSAPERPRLFICQLRGVFGGAPLFRFSSVFGGKKKKREKNHSTPTSSFKNLSPSIPRRTLLSSPPPPLPRHRRAPPLPNRRGGARAIVRDERERAPVEARQFPEILSSPPVAARQRCCVSNL